MYICVVLAVLKKNYARLCNCLPHNYMMTINKIKEIVTLSDECLSSLNEPPNADLLNEKLIVSSMLTIKSDMDAFEFCDIVEQLIDTKSSDIEIIRNGNITRK